ncbi:MAG: SIS domain-containing protein [Armatimonadetes bacterium]|nr:SIS domain-containing protein [Armatimonadota bacterium]
MRREIREESAVVARLLDAEWPRLRRLAARLRRRPPRLVVFVARGTSDNAATLGKYLVESLTGLPASLAAPSVVTLYGARPRLRDALVLAVSQSGRSTDVVEFVEEARRQGGLTVGITNDARSPLARTAHETLLCRAGPERSVAATKTYVAEVALLTLLVGAWARAREVEQGAGALPDALAATLKMEDEIAARAERYRYMQGCLVTSRGYNYATAKEAALKLKETCYLPAEALSSADLLHGPIAIVERDFPVMVIAPSGVPLAHLRQITARLAARGAETMVISDDAEILARAKVALPLVAPVPEVWSPAVAIVPAQLLSLHLAVARGFDPDRPRGLRKVTFTR